MERSASHQSGLVYRQAFALTGALNTLLAGQKPDLGRVTHELFVCMRASEPRLPDHFYRAYRKKRLGRDVPKSYADFLWTVLDGLAGRYLDDDRGGLTPTRNSFGDWQNAVPGLSPLMVLIAGLERRHRPTDDRDWRATTKAVRGTLTNTALLAPRINSLEDIARRDGLNEMHMHLNGATEVDKIWTQAVARPRHQAADLQDAFDKSRMVREQYDQIELGLTPKAIGFRLRAARRVRWLLALNLFEGRPFSEMELLHAMAAPARDGETDFMGVVPASRHPAQLLPAAFRPSDREPLVQEAMFLAKAVHALRDPRQPNRESIALGLWFNFLVMHQIAGISVQQSNQYGFDQFQKFTLNDARERIEEDYEDRFHQIGYVPWGDHDLLEGRFAPKSDPRKLEKLLSSIATGFARYRGCRRAHHAWHPLSGEIPACLQREPWATCTRCTSGNPTQLRRAKLSLVAHFIKKPDADASKFRKNALSPKAYCRHHTRRRELEQETGALLALMRRSKVARHLITGIDAAANELDTPPEVFAPTFRRMRRHGIHHATYHAGEDFPHLCSGIRAIWEAVQCLDLRDGDRLGHGTAVGIDPTFWTTCMADSVALYIETALDDAVFAYWRLSHIDGHAACLGRLADRIADWSERIYGEPQDPRLLRQAWTLRRLDARRLEDGASARWTSPDRSEETRLLAEAERANPAAYALFCRYHLASVRNNGQTLVELGTNGDDEPLYQPHDLHALQQDAVKMLNDRHVVIETLPTSNVRISFYAPHAEHHLYRWLGVCDPEGFTDSHRPTVCVGSDDTGIFATNLRNEYSHIYLTLRDTYGLSDQDATDMIRRLNDNGRRHFFTEEMPVSYVCR